MRFCFLISFLLFTLNVMGFDQVRNGPFVSLGSGINLNKSDLTLLDSSVLSLQDAGSSIQFKYGSGALKRLSLYSLINQRHYFSQEQQDGYFMTDIGLGAQYYFTSYIRTAYMVGSAATAVSKFEGEKISIGRSVHLGLGFEIVRNWQLELLWASTRSTINHTLYNQLDSQSVQLTINYIWY